MDDTYVIRTKGHLDPRWTARFDGLNLSQEDDGSTVLRGPLPDQAALFGVLMKLRDLPPPVRRRPARAPARRTPGGRAGAAPQGEPLVRRAREPVEAVRHAPAAKDFGLATELPGGRRTSAGQGVVDPLSERELDVLHLLGSDLDGPDIARELSVSLSTVRTHTRGIYAELGVKNRRSAVRAAAELNLLRSPTRTRPGR